MDTNKYDCYFLDDDYDYDNDNDNDNDDDNDDKSIINKSSIKIYSTEEILLGFCDYKRYKWYIKKGLGETFCGDGIKLNFSHKQYIIDKKLIYRETLCNCCGSKNYLQKLHVLPSQIKKYYPDEKKKHNITDILLICKDCSSNAYHFMNKLQEKIYSSLDIKENDFIDNDKKQIKIFSLWLYKRIANIDIEKNKNKYKLKMNKLKKLLNIENDLTSEELEKYTKIDYSKEKDGCKTINEYIVKKFIEKNKLDYLTNIWKENFIICISPKYLPYDFIESLLNTDNEEIIKYLTEMNFVKDK
jgi:hypothetical protein